MERFQIEQITRRNPKGRVCFSYFKDRYAPMILSWIVGEGRRVAELKRSRFSGLLDKAVVRRVASASGDGVLRRDALLRACFDPEIVPAGKLEQFRVTFGEWGDPDDWYPSWTTRPGVNLVLQLSFTRRHNRAYYALVRPDEDDHAFMYEDHPNASDGLLTMAWARIDVALDCGEAIIEEVQSDWIKRAESLRRHLRRYDDCTYDDCWCLHQFSRESSRESLIAYLDGVLPPYADLWAEATLCAALWYLRDHVGIRRIFFNTFESGLRLKHLESSTPPRWIYSTLPKRFCFERTQVRPRALARSRHDDVRRVLRGRGLEWFLLEL